MPLSFYNNLVHQIHLLYIFSSAENRFTFGFFLVFFVLWLLCFWDWTRLFEYLVRWVFSFNIYTCSKECSAHLTVSCLETSLIDLMMCPTPLVDTYLVTFWANSCSAVLGVGVSSFSPSAAGTPPSVSALVSERHRAAALNELFVHTQYCLVVCYPHRGCVLCTVKEKSNKDMLSLTFSCWNQRTADRWNYFYLDWCQRILWIGLHFGDNKQSYYCT